MYQSMDTYTCNRCDEVATVWRGAPGPPRWRELLGNGRIDLCPSCAGLFAHWLDTFRTKKRAAKALEAAEQPVKVEGYGEIVPTPVPYPGDEGC